MLDALTVPVRAVQGPARSRVNAAGLTGLQEDTTTGCGRLLGGLLRMPAERPHENKPVAKSYTVREIGSELLLYDPESDEVHILNATARLVYELHQKGNTAGQIAEVLRSRFVLGDDANVIGDVEECLDDLRKKGIIAPEMQTGTTA